MHGVSGCAGSEWVTLASLVVQGVNELLSRLLVVQGVNGYCHVF